MKGHEIIKVVEIIKSPLCISADDGQIVFDTLAPMLKEGRKVTISFEGATTIISLFLNVAIGQLYGSLEENRIKNQLQVAGLFDDDLEMLKRVVDNAKRYYANSESYDQAWEMEIGSESGNR